MNPFTFIKDARLQYLEYLDAGGYEIVVAQNPHRSSGEIAVYDSSLGLCPKKAAMERLGLEPSHPNLAILGLCDLHRMRNGVVVEHDWIATLRYFHPGLWLVSDGVSLNGSTRGKLDAFLVIPNPNDQPQIGDDRFEQVLVEIKRTDGDLKDRYLFQLCHYQYKWGRALGKLILDHRHTIREYTVMPELGKWIVLNEGGQVVKEVLVDDLLEEVAQHRWWLDELSTYSNTRFKLPAGIQSPLDSWECHQDWRKREGKARFRCPWGGYCFGIQADEFDVHNEKEGRKIVARVVVADDGREFRHAEVSGDE